MSVLQESEDSMKNHAVDGNNVKKLRNAKGWSQQHLADITGLSHVTINKIEKNYKRKPHWVTIHRLIEALCVSNVTELFPNYWGSQRYSPPDTHTDADRSLPRGSKQEL